MLNARPLILYHGQCPDGFAAAWSAWRLYGKVADYVPVHHGQPPPDVTGRLVYILDFSYKRDILLAMATKADHISVFDHHKSAQDDLAGGYESTFLKGFRHLGNNLMVKFDMAKSGGRLAWEHFQGSQPVSWIIDYTMDRDLWQWKLPHSKRISAYMASYDFSFELWEAWSTVAVESPEWMRFAEEGAAILRYQSQVIDSACKKAVEVEWPGYGKILVTNTTTLASEITGKLAVGRPFGATYFIRENGQVIVSLRSDDNGLDVSKVASSLGGGGHRAAAGMQVPSMNHLPWVPCA